MTRRLGSYMFQSKSEVSLNPQPFTESIPVHADIICRYLEGHVFDTAIRLNVRECLFENAIASLRCLHEALRQFNDNSLNTARDVPIAYGLWGFVPYATEYWCVMFREIALVPEEEWDPRFSSVAMAASTALHALRGLEERTPETSNKDLDAMRRFHGLWYDATIGLQARAAGRSRATNPDEGEHP